jgi:hypothetical protein
MWDQIAAKFDVVGKPIIFAWGDTIFNPERVPLTKELHAHEEVHGERQWAYREGPCPCPAEAVELWWQRYLIDPEFRLDEEIPAHAAEYKAYCKRHHGTHARSTALAMIARKLASPLYGGLIGQADAERCVLIGRQRELFAPSDLTAPPFGAH